MHIEQHHTAGGHQIPILLSGMRKAAHTGEEAKLTQRDVEGGGGWVFQNSGRLDVATSRIK
jgi:hypothetical protein